MKRKILVGLGIAALAVGLIWAACAEDVEAVNVHMREVQPADFGRPFGGVDTAGVALPDSVWFGATRMRWWHTAKIGSYFDNFYMSFQPDSTLYGAIYIIGGPSFASGHGLLRLANNFGQAGISDASAGSPAMAVYTDYQADGRGIYARLGANGTNAGAAGYFENADTTYASSAVYASANWDSKNALVVGNGVVDLTAADTLKLGSAVVTGTTSVPIADSAKTVTDGAIDAAAIATDGVGAAEIAAGAVDAAEIATGAVGYDEMSVLTKAIGFPAASRVAHQDTIWTLPADTTGTFYLGAIRDEGYTTSQIIRCSEDVFDSTYIVARVDGVTACSLLVCDWAGIPYGAVGSTAPLPTTGDGLVSHALGRTTMRQKPSFTTRHVIPFEDSIKFYLIVPDSCNGGVAILWDCDYRVAEVSDWSAWKNWHGTYTEILMTDSVEYTVLDTGAGKAGVYLGSALYAHSDTAHQNLASRAVKFIYDAEVGSDQMSPATYGWCLAGYNFNAGSTATPYENWNDLWAGAYIYNYDVSGDQNFDYAGYRWYTRDPVSFTTRFRIVSDNDADYPLDLYTRWVSFYYTED